MSMETDTVNEIMDYVYERTRDFSLDERITMLCYVAEHCKAYTQTVLAHEYHKSLYPSKDKS